MVEAIAFWANLATVLLALEAVLLLVVPGVLCYFAVRGARWLLRNGRPFFREVRAWTERVQEVTETASAALAGPAIQVRTLPAWLQGVRRGLRKMHER